MSEHISQVMSIYDFTSHIILDKAEAVVSRRRVEWRWKESESELLAERSKKRKKQDIYGKMNLT